MRGFYVKPDVCMQMYGMTYHCNHPKYDACTLYLDSYGIRGLAVIQQRYDKKSKHTWWGPIDPWLANDIYLARGFVDAFDELAAEVDEDLLFPTIEVRKLMWLLKLRPMRKELWEA